MPFPNTNPATIEKVISVNSTANTCISSAPLPDIISLTTVKANVKKIITSTSIATVTPKTVSVNTPDALVSLIIAMADDGDRATAITPIRIEKANRADVDRAFVKSKKGPTKKEKRNTIKKTTSDSATIFVMIAFLRVDSELMCNAPPAEKAMKLRARSSIS